MSTGQGSHIKVRAEERGAESKLHRRSELGPPDKLYNHLAVGETVAFQLPNDAPLVSSSATGITSNSTTTTIFGKIIEKVVRPKDTTSSGRAALAGINERFPLYLVEVNTGKKNQTIELFGSALTRIPPKSLQI